MLHVRRRTSWTGFEWLAVVALVSIVACPVASQSPLPFSPLETPVPDAVGAPLGVGDVNGDGAPDLIVNGAPFVLLNDGHGLFTAAVGSSGYAGFNPRTVITDFNQDGRADLLTQT